MPKTHEELTSELDALKSRAAELAAKAEDTNTTLADVKSIQSQINDDIKPVIERLESERAEAAREVELKGLRNEITTLNAAMEGLRKPSEEFSLGPVSTDQGTKSVDDVYASGEYSYFSDIRLAGKGIQSARDRLESVASALEGKAMATNTPENGGYFVQKQIERQIVEALELDNVVRALSTKVSVNTNEIQLDNLSLGTAAAWVAELQEKFESTSTGLVSVSAGVHTAAGLATISNQLLADSNPAIDKFVTADLSKRLVALEEQAFLNGSGSGQPLGILNTPGLQSQPITVTGVTADGGLLDSILDAIGKVQTEHGEPTAIVMHPRTWTRILKSKDAAGVYMVGSPSVQDPRVASKSIFGYKVVTSNRVPTNLGTGTNESRIIVGDFSEALVLDRQGITVDESTHVRFTTNATVFRAEQRVGFTAARAPKAFAVIGGAGLANG